MELVFVYLEAFPSKHSDLRWIAIMKGEQFPIKKHDTNKAVQPASVNETVFLL